MTLTLLDIYNECAGQPWSMFDSDAASEEDFEKAMKISINKALSYLWNSYPWSFRTAKKAIKTKAGTNNYALPNGLLTKKTISGAEKYGVKYNKKYLTYEPSFEILEEREGEPEYFYIDGDTLFLYPTPDDAYEINLSYMKSYFAKSNDGDDKLELSDDDDYINIPEKYETIFKNCLISLAMVYAIAEETDESYSAYQKQFEDALAVILKYCKNGIIDKNIVW